MTHSSPWKEQTFLLQVVIEALLYFLQQTVAFMKALDDVIELKHYKSD